jgi:GntR family transcriptional regulator
VGTCPAVMREELTVSDTAATPRYEEIADELRRIVATLPPGARVPSEAELCERFEVSRMTARHAVDQLVRDHLVERRRGAGTFVAAPRIHRLLGSPLSFTEAMRVKGLTASSQLIQRGPVDPTPEEAAGLGLLDDERAYVLERLRLADGIPMAVERAVLPLDVAEHLEGDVETGSLHTAFARLGRRPTRAYAEVFAERVPARYRRLLELPASGIVLCERRTISDQDGAPLEHTLTSYASERYSFEAVLFPDPDHPSTGAVADGPATSS